MKLMMKVNHPLLMVTQKIVEDLLSLIQITFENIFYGQNNYFIYYIVKE